MSPPGAPPPAGARVAVWAALSLLACRAAATPAGPAAEPAHVLVAAGERIPTEAPVVLWSEAPFYDAHSTRPRFAREGERGLRYTPSRRVADPALAERVAREGWNLATLREAVDLVVLHYDACGLSRECFRVLQDQRGLSAHFLLDLDGTVYQTLDLEHQAWHARQANPRSIGIEIAQVGAWPESDMEALRRWYVHDGPGGAARLRVPAALGDGGLRDASYRGAPARGALQRGRVNGRELVQYDLTPEQYDSLEKLGATLVTLFPRIRPDIPRRADGSPQLDVLDERGFEAFRGILGHQHVTREKVDPGPAFQWERFLAGLRQRLAAP